MTYLFYFLLSAALIVLQSTIPVHRFCSGAVFDLLLPFIVYLGLFQPLITGFVVVVLLGYARDALSAGPFGIHLCVYVWIFLGVRLSTGYIRSDSLLMQPFLLGGASLVCNLMLMGFIALSGEGGHEFGSHVQRTFFQAIAAAFLGPVLVQAIRLVDEKPVPPASGMRREKHQRGDLPP